MKINYFKTILSWPFNSALQRCSLQERSHFSVEKVEFMILRKMFKNQSQPSKAFPLAPLCAFLNNIFEIRIDAAKYTKYKKRTIPVRTKSIGIWYPIFRFIGLLAIVTNVCSDSDCV